MTATLPKISLVGAGRVGSTIAYSILLRGLARELVIMDHQPEIALGEAYDLLHASPFAHPMQIRAGGLEETANSDIIVLTASVPSPQIRNRLELGDGNARLLQSLIPPLARCSPEAILLVVTNPLDLMTYLALQLSGYPSTRVIGTGTLVDSARFRVLVAQATGTHAGDVHAYILGEHGETQFAVISSAQVGGQPLARDTAQVDHLFEQAKNGGFQVYNHKGYTSFAIALAATTIIECIANDSHRILPVSIHIDGYLGVRDICLSIPAVLGREGVVRMVELELNASEAAHFRASATAMKAAYAALPIMRAEAA